MREVLKLFACCVPVRGARRGMVCDVQRGRYHLVPLALLDLIDAYDGRPIEAMFADHEDHRDVVESYVEFLLGNEIAFLTVTPDRFPTLDLTWEDPRAITNAIVDVDERSGHDWNAIVAALDVLGCRALQVRAFEGPSALWAAAAVAAVGSRLRSVDLIVPYEPGLEDRYYADYVLRNEVVSSFTVHGAPFEESRQIGELGLYVHYSRTAVTGPACCGVVDPAYFAVGLEHVSEAQSYNTCLNRKISVGADGAVRNCPSMSRSFGQFGEVRLEDVVADPAFREPWGVAKDQIEVCKDCEFRYVCTDCRAYVAGPGGPLAKPAKCDYDPYTATWANAPKL